MTTLKQLLVCRKKKYMRTTVPALNACPQKKAICTKIFIKTPKKPHSAQRKVAKVKILNYKYKIEAYIPGIGHNLQEFSTVLVRGGRVKDLPGVKYHLIRGKFDLKGLLARKQARSKYGTKHWNKQNITKNL